MRPREIDIDVADASLTGFASNVTGAAFTITTTTPTDGIAHRVSIRNDSATNHSGKTVTLVGTDQDNNALTEVVTGPNTSATVESAGYFKTLTSATPSATIGADTFDIGWVDEVISQTILLDWRESGPFTLNVDVTGTLDFTVQQTFDYPLQGAAALQAAQWLDITALAAKTADTTASTTPGATAVRIKLNSYSSGAEVQMNVAPGVGESVSGQQITIDQTTGAGATIGVTTDAAVITDANGTIQQYLRGLIKQWIAGTLKIGAGENHAMQVGGTTPRVVGATYTKPASATQYTAGDIIANSATGASVTPITFSVERTNAAIVSGRVSGVRCVITPASGNLVYPAFDLLLFRPATNIPFAAAGYPADNAALTLTAAMAKELVGVLSFSATGWRGVTGDLTTNGSFGYQAVSFATRPYAPFNLSDIASATTLLGIMQDRSGWNPGNVANAFDFVLDTDVD